MSLWDSIKSEWGDGLPHELGELKLALPEGSVKFEIRYLKTEYSDQRLEVQLSDSGDYAPIMGRVAEDVFFTAKDPYFVLSETSERLFFSRDKTTMKDYMTAKMEFRVQTESLKDKFAKDKSAARADLKRAEKKRADLIAVLDRVEANWETGGRWNQKKINLQWERVNEQDDLISAANAVLSQTSPPPISPSYTRAIRFCGLDVLDLSKIVGAVKSTKAELMKSLGVLPKKVAVIPVLPMLNLLVEWT